jgi:hypothetical protein
MITALVCVAAATVAIAQTTRPGGNGTVPEREAPARKVVYVADAGASMKDVMPGLRDQMKQSIASMVPLQFFNLILFSADDVIAFNVKGLVIASPSNKDKAYEWLDKAEAKGGSNPIPAIRKAFESKPELIYLLTDGFDKVEQAQELFDEIAKQNPNQRVKVNCILLVEKAIDKDDALIKSLKRIADENRGIFKLVDKSKF